MTEQQNPIKQDAAGNPPDADPAEAERGAPAGHGGERQHRRCRLEGCPGLAHPDSAAAVDGRTCACSGVRTALLQPLLEDGALTTTLPLPEAIREHVLAQTGELDVG